ncbi:MAG: hypothetical protein V3R16_02565 [Nitrospirales bacterium]
MPHRHVSQLCKKRFGPFESYVYQCVKCGEQVGFRVPRGKLNEHAKTVARLWNPRLRCRGRATARTRRYQAYMASPEWKRLRHEILERDGYICQLCEEGATEVHHVSYLRFGHESPLDLIAVCRDCNQDQKQKSVFHRLMETHNLKGER